MNSILYVDDDLDDHEVFSEAVASINPGITCYLATDGKNALDLLNDLDILPDYIFLDLNMPRLNGKEFLYSLRESERLKNIDVIIYSTSNNPRDVEECRKLGAIDFIIKPSTWDRIYESINKFIPESQPATVVVVEGKFNSPNP
jgi:CheY-like chemotaxis protein